MQGLPWDSRQTQYGTMGNDQRMMARRSRYAGLGYLIFLWANEIQIFATPTGRKRDSGVGRPLDSESETWQTPDSAP